MRISDWSSDVCSSDVSGDGNRLTGLTYKDRERGTEHQIELEGIFVQIGLVPNHEWLKGAIALTPRGEIEIHERGATHQPGACHAGDATTVPSKPTVASPGAAPTPRPHRSHHN